MDTAGAEFLADPRVQDKVMANSIKKHKVTLRKRGLPATEMNLWGLHNQGGRGISEIMREVNTGKTSLSIG